MASSPAAPPACLLLLALCFALHGVAVEGSRVTSSTTASPNTTFGHRAWAFTPNESVFYGARAKLSVHGLPDVATNQSSFAFIEVANNYLSGLNVIQAGWLVSPDLFGDTQTHLFTYWMAGGQGCYNVLCNGFVVQSGSSIVPGSVLNPASSDAGKPKSITLTIYRDGVSGDWYLWYEDGTQNTQVGYWPKSLFTGLADMATQIGYGGIVSSASINQKSPPMGSGHRAAEGDGRAASFENLQFLDEGGDASDYDHLATGADAPQCYDIALFPQNGDGLHFYYGGPPGC